MNLLIYMLPMPAAFVLDLIIGDPHWLPHPVRLIGKGIETGERILRKIFPHTQRGLTAAGAVLGTAIPVLSFGVSFFILFFLYSMNIWLGLAAETFMCFQILAVRSLKNESMKVYDELKNGTLEGARSKVSMIVGRDTGHLSSEQVAKAAVETVAENTSDGTAAPLFFMALGGAPLGFFYKGINTLDSMVGYKNDRYMFFGRFSAKLDDAANFIPARLCALLMTAASGFLGMDMKNAWRIFRRDRFNHASPNSAQTEAVCAGALDIQLAGDAYYFGRLYPKKTIGDSIRPVSCEDIPAANRLMYVTALLCLLVSLMLRMAVYAV